MEKEKVQQKGKEEPEKNTEQAEDYITRYDFKRFISDAGEGKELKIGNTVAKNLKELAELLEKLNEKEYLDAAMQGKISEWVKSLGDERLSHQLRHIRLKKNAVGLVKYRIQELHSYIRHPEESYILKGVYLYLENFEFYSDHELCSRCEICLTVCPKEALEIKDNRLAVNDDCSQCGLCMAFCPTGAIKKFHNKNTEDVMLALGHMPLFPEFTEINTRKVRKYLVGTHKVKENCPEDCEACVSVCPVGIIQKYDKEGKILDRIRIDRNKCLHCGACKIACPYDLIEIKKNRIDYMGEGYSSAWGEAVNKLLGPEALNAWHISRSHNKIKELITESELVKYTMKKAESKTKKPINAG